MTQFSRSFNTPKYGQVVAMLDDHEDGRPEIRCYVQPSAEFGFGLCKTSIVFKADVQGEAARRAFFDKMTASMAEAMVASIFDYTTPQESP
jgi:hypothetical protein